MGAIHLSCCCAKVGEDMPLSSCEAVGGCCCSGLHVFVLVHQALCADTTADGSAFGVALVNSNAIEVSLTADGISWRAVGGILDFHILAGW